MRRILLFICILIATVLSLSCCGSEVEFTFRDHHFGDTMEKVKSSEGDVLKADEVNGYQFIDYSDVNFSNFIGRIGFVFKEDKLKYILFGPAANKDKQMTDVYNNIKDALSVYGGPDQESESNKVHKALWKKSNYGIVLLALNSIEITFCSDPSKAEKYYNTLQVTDLFSD